MTSITEEGHDSRPALEGALVVRTPADAGRATDARGTPAPGPMAGPSGVPMVAFDALIPVLSATGSARLQRHAMPFHATPSVLRQEGDPCRAVTLLASGSLRVAKRRASGREITLYFVQPGSLCALEVLAVLAGTPYAAEAVVEVAATGASIPAAAFRELVEAEPGLRAYLDRLVDSRMSLVLDLVGDVALGRLESRLAAAVLQHAGPADVAMVTHERLAQELACAREAVSRALGGWERAGIVRLGRGSLTVLDADRLEAFAHGADRGAPIVPPGPASQYSGHPR